MTKSIDLIKCSNCVYWKCLENCNKGKCLKLGNKSLGSELIMSWPVTILTNDEFYCSEGKRLDRGSIKIKKE